MRCTVACSCSLLQPISFANIILAFPRQHQVVDKVTRGIVAKLLHGPMNHLRQQTEGDATRAAILQVQQAFQLLEDH